MTSLTLYSGKLAQKIRTNMERVVITTDNHQTVYYPGQVVSGTCTLDLENPLQVKEIMMKFKGKAHCHWTEGGGENTRYYFANEKYFDTKVTVIGREQTGQESVEVPRGHHSYPFSFNVPNSDKLPPSYEGHGGYVRYSLSAFLDIPWKRKRKTKLVINIMSLLDLNTIRTENLMKPSERKGLKTICCLCCESNPITVYMNTERKGYVPGDTVVFNAEIVNGSRRTLKKVKAQLIQIVTFIAGGKRKDFINKLQKIFHGSLDAAGSDIFRNERLTIPAVPPSYLRGCNIIDVRYYVQIALFPSGPSLNLRVNAEIVVGSIPLAEIAQQHGVTVPPSSSTTPGGLYGETAFSSIPQASYAESALGDPHFGAKKKGDDKSKDSGFVPSYTYYKWDQPNTTDMFAAK